MLLCRRNIHHHIFRVIVLIILRLCRSCKADELKTEKDCLRLALSVCTIGELDRVECTGYEDMDTHDYLATCGITYSEIMRLDELGLVNSSGLLVLKVRTTTDQAVVFNNDRLLVMIKPAGEDAVNLDVKQFPLTDVGRELYGVQDIATPDSCYKVFVKELSKNKKIAVEMHKVIRIHGDQIEYNPAIILNDDQTGDV